MSTIEEKVVSMKFDGKQFQNGVNDTINGISRLKKGLNFSGSEKGIDNINKSIHGISFDGLTKGLDTVKLKFSALQIAGITALTNIVNSAVNAGKRIASSLTIDPIFEGFHEYETQMNAIQTILANTSSKGSTLEDVNKALAELNTYSDQTIYNFTEMTKNIGTFTAAGVSLEDSTSAIKGIANLAAVSGSSSAQASNAMYQLSQALASGKVSLQDWNSVVNAGMGGEVFQNALKRTGKMMGKTIDDTQTFRDSISSKSGTGWLTSDVLVETLNEFTGDMSEAELAAKGYTKEQIKDIMEMGKTAVDAATKVKTLSQLLDTLKESVGSGWAKTWQIIFGDFGQAKEMFTSVSDTLSSMINKSASQRNNMLEGWEELGGRTALIDSIKNSFDALMGVVSSVSGAFRDIFPYVTSEQLYNITEGLKQLTENFKMSDGTLSNLRSTFKGLFAILDIGKQVFEGIISGLSIMLSGSDSLGRSILSATGSFGEFLTALDNTIKSSGIINTVITAIAKTVRNVFKGAGDAIEFFGIQFAKARDSVIKELHFDPWVSFSGTLTNIGKGIGYICDKISELQSKISNMFQHLGEKFSGIDIGDQIKGAYDALSLLLVDQSEAVEASDEEMQSSFTTSMSNFVKNISGISIAAIGFAVSKMVMTVTEIFRKHGNIGSIFGGYLETFKKGVGSIEKTLNGVRDCLKAYQMQLKAGILLKIAIAIGILAAAISAISLIDSGKLAVSLAAIGGLFAQLLVATKLFSLIGKFKTSALKSSVVMFTMSTSILILAHAMKIIGSLNLQQTITALGSIMGLIGAMTLSIKLLSKDSGSFIKGSLGILAFAEAIKILADACKKVGELDWEVIKKGLMGVGALMLELSLFLNKTDPSLNLKVSVSILILSAAINNMGYALKDIGELDWEVIKKGLLGIGWVLAEIAAFDKLTSDTKKVLSTSISMGIISIAMNNMGNALSNIGKLDWEVIKKGLIGIGGVLTEVSVFGKMSANTKNLIKTSGTLVIVALALQQMYEPLKNIGSLDWENIKKGLIGMGGALAEISLFTKLSGNTKGSIKSVISLGIAVSALSTLAHGLQEFGKLSWDQITRGLVGMGGALAEIIITMDLLSSNAPINGLALIEICTALSILTKAFVGFSGLSWEQITKGIVATASALTAIAIAMKLIPEDSIWTALGLTGVASALVTLSQAMVTISGLSWEGVAKSLIAIGGSLVILAGGIKLMDGCLGGVMVLIAACLALNLLVPPILQLSTMSWDGLLISLATLAGTFAVLGIAAAVLSPVIPSMYALSGALVLLGVAVVGIGAGIALATFGLQQLSQAFLDLDGTTEEGAKHVELAMTAMVIGIANGIPTLVKKIGEGLTIILQYLIDAIPLFTDFVLKAILAMTASIAENAPKITENVVKTLDGILDVLVKYTPILGDKVVKILLSMLKILSDNIPKFVTAGTNILVGFLKGISDNLPRVIDAAFKVVISFINGLADAIRDNAGPIADAALNLIDALFDAIGTFNYKLFDAGVNAVKGFIKGLASIPGDIWKAGCDIGKTAVNAIMHSLDEHSPSKKMKQVGIFAGQGFVNGLVAMTKKVYESGSSMGNKALNSVTNSVSQISSFLDDNLNTNPVITPVLDLDEIQNGSKSLFKLMDNVDSINASVSYASRNANTIKEKQEFIPRETNKDTPNHIPLNNSSKTPMKIQLVLGNGREIAEYIVDDIDELMGENNNIYGRKVGL